MGLVKVIYDFWVQCHYRFIATTLESKHLLNEDALHDALVSLHDNVQSYESITMDELSTLFQEEYRRYDRKSFSAVKQHLHFEPQILDSIVSENGEYDDCECPDNEAALKKICGSLKRTAHRLHLDED